MPPPPPPPPPGMQGAACTTVGGPNFLPPPVIPTRQTRFRPSSEMRKLRLERLATDRLDNSFWKKSGSEADLDRLEANLQEMGIFEEFESSFGAGKKGRAKSLAVEETLDTKKEEITFIDGRKAQNISKYFTSTFSSE